MARPHAVSPFLSGNPVRLGPEIASLEDLYRATGLDPSAFAVVPLVDRVVLIHSLTGAAGPITLRWVRLPHAPSLLDARPVDLAVVLTAPMKEAARAIELVSRLAACLGDARFAEEARDATTREALASALASTEQRAGASPLRSENLLALLGTTPGGLSTDEARRRQVACGPNRIERLRRRSLASRLLEQFSSFFALLLWVGAGFALLAGMPELAWAIVAVISINGAFSFIQEYRAERAVEALQRLLPREITALRDDGEARLPVVEVVPGDVVRVDEGDQVPADGQLLSSDGLRVDQSALTGESHPVFKLSAVGNERANVPQEERPELLFAGTSVVAGAGVFVVWAIGMATEIGAVAQLTQAVREEPSPLQREMARVTRVVTVLAVAFGVGFFLLGVATGVLTLGEGFLFALGVIVANVPEGLLPTLSLALAIGAQRMARQRSLIKRLSGVETLGATTVICTDKTGTLTENRMRARFLWLAGRTLPAEAIAGDEAPGLRELLEAGVLASQATLDRGDPTERAIVAAAASAGVEIDKTRRAHDLLAPYPFDSFRKRMTLVRASRSGPTAYVKGAPKETLALCRQVRWGELDVPLTDEARSRVMADHDRLAADGLRVLAIAVRPVADEQLGAAASSVERELTLLGLVALWDPPRPEVAPAVALCRRAGIRVVMITGDYGLTANAIARQIGLPAEKIVTGDEVERISTEALAELLAEPGVLFARTSPADKLRIVRTLRARGEVVAVTGDGVNDAPALKAADIGVAMGERGSDVAKEAAEMVITDDNFASIVAAIRQGRAIYANMGKFVTYIFASNVPELVPFLAMVFLRIPLPLTVIQILAVDLGTDMLPALSLGAEPPEPGVMDRPPRARGERLLGWRRLLRAYAFLGVAEAALALLAFFWTYWIAGWRPGLPMAASGELYRRATTMTLAGIVAAQVGNVFACRTDRESVFRIGFWSNRLAVLSIVAEVGILAALILVPPLPGIFGLAVPGLDELKILVLFPGVILLLEETRKAVVRRVAATRTTDLVQRRTVR